MKKEKILVVDDEEVIVSLAERILQREGFETAVASNCKEALSLLEEHNIDLLITDIKMPGMSGMDLLQQFKAKWPENAAIIVTGYGTIEMALDAMQRGADGFILKPFGHNDLMTVVNNAMEKMRLIEENVRLKSLLPLFETSRRMVQEVNTDNLLKYVAHVATGETGADYISIMLKKNNGSFAQKIQRGLDGLPEKGMIAALGEEMAMKAAKTGKHIVLKKGAPGNELDPIMVEGEMTSMTFPLQVKDEVFGAINLAKLGKIENEPDQGNIDLVGILASQASVALKNAMLIEDLHELFISSIKSFSETIDTKSPWTAGHSERVTRYALLIGKALNFNEDDLYHLELAGLLHDIGKVGTPESILNKAGKLTKVEFQQMKKHPVAGSAIISHIKQMQSIIPAVRHHHERYDGGGYPDGLKGREIPLLARILSVADSFDAMKADRPYREGRTLAFIINEFQVNAGKQFDPEPVEALLKIIEKEEEMLMKV
ncbi:MAG: response regulator [Deltaproteobacteria bacterium]|nr:response regulator [Deltaproteobacteria bacterium]